jgi:hypothetical protein
VSKSKLVCKWKDKTTEMRLVMSGRCTSGYADIYIIEKLSQDSLGDPVWITVATWDRQDGGGWGAATSLADALVQRGGELYVLERRLRSALLEYGDKPADLAGSIVALLHGGGE